MTFYRRFDNDPLDQTPPDVGYFGRAGLEVQVKPVTDLPGYTKALQVTQVAGNRCGITLFDELQHEESGEFLLLQKMGATQSDTSTVFIGAAVACGGTTDTSLSCRAGIFREPLRTQFVTYNNGAFSDVAGNTPSPAFDARNWHFLRVRFQFTKIQMRWWYPGNDEPTSWLFETTRATPNDIPPGKVGWSCSHQTGNQLALFVVGPIGKVEIPPALNHSVSGIITDANGQPCQRKVYAVTRPTDGTAPEVVAHGLSDPATGEYTLGLPTTAEVSRVVVSEDDDSPLLNDLIDRIIPA